MPAWVWILLGLTTLGFGLWVLDARGLDVTERFGKTLAVLLILALLCGLLFSFLNADWR